ncbi:MAG: RNA polymerase sigma factor [Planctomycetota bacterium]
MTERVAPPRPRTNGGEPADDPAVSPTDASGASGRAAAAAADALASDDQPSKLRAARDTDAARDLHARQLMLRAQRGDQDAFGELFDTWHKPLFNFFVRMCRDRTIADDLVQETFLRLWRSAGRYHPSGKFTTYLFQIARNFWLNEREKLARRRHLSLDSPTGSGAVDDGNMSLKDLLSGSGATPLQLASDNEAASLARDAIDDLDEKHRLVLVLAVFHNFRYREIAEILEIPEGTVKTRMMHAERKLREKLTRKKLDA